MGSAAAMAANVSLYKQPPFDPLRDLAPISLIAIQPNVLILHPSVPANSVAELLAYAKANPGKLNYGTSGAGSSQHMAGALFVQMTKVDILHVPYRGGAPASTDLIAGQIQVIFQTSPEAMPLIRALFFAAVALLAAAPAYADGTVLRAKGCGDKIFVASENGYSVLAGAGQGVAGDGDKLVGEVDRIGFASFYDPKSGSRFSASIDERGLSKAEINQRIAASCRSETAYGETSGQVERAAGCGNKIFVSTAQGYAVLERLAGGIVAPGTAARSRLRLRCRPNATTGPVTDRLSPV